MTCDVYNGGNTVLAGQLEPSYRTPSATPNAIKLKFSDFDFARNPLRQDDPTISDTTLMQKTDEVDESPTGSLTAIACLNDMTFWLYLLLGAPVVTGTGPYVHTFTLTRDCRPSALLEADMRHQLVHRIRRYLGVSVNTLGWDVLGDDQNLTLALLIATQLRPFPTTNFDATLTSFPKQRAAAAKCRIYDVLGASTLGQMSGGTIEFNNDMEPVKYADGLFGYGDVQVGQPAVSGTLNALFRDGTLMDFAEAHASKKLVLDIASLDGTATCKITIPSVEFNEPSVANPTSKGLVVNVNWKAHAKEGDPPITVVLTNAVPGLTAV